MQYHPDKNKTDPDATTKFINIRQAYKILSNYRTRNIYDETGEYELEEKEPINRYNTINDFRKRLTIDDIINYKKKYIGSKEEEQDLIHFYNKYNGDISHILQCIPYSRNKDIKRYLDIYETLFRNKKLTKNAKYEETKNNIILMIKNKKEEKEAKELLDKLTKQIIERRSKKRNLDDYLLDLAKKYENDKIDEIKEEISEKEFQKVFKNIKNKNKKNINKK